MTDQVSNPTPEQIAQAEAEAAAAAAEAATQNEDQKSSKKRYFRSAIAGLTIHVPGLDPVRFLPFYERVNGDDSKVGYLETANAKVIAACEEDFNVTSITKSHYDKSTLEKYDDEGKTLGARRAAY